MLKSLESGSGEMKGAKDELSYVQCIFKYLMSRLNTSIHT